MAQIYVSRCVLLVSTHRHSRSVAPRSLRLSRSQELAKRAQHANAKSQAAAKILDAVAGCGGQLHDALRELGYADRLRSSADKLPVAQNRLSYIARLTGEAAEKVLSLVDDAKVRQTNIVNATKQMR